jgi:glycosyltransferase involved in cell wall biosynthesis
VSKRLKVLHVLWSGEIFDYSKYEIYLCFLSMKGLIFEEASKLNNVNVAFIGIKNRFDIIGAIKFAYYLRSIKFDIIHSHMRNFLSTAIMMLFACRVPKILTHHVGPVDVRLFKKERRFYELFSGIFQEIIAISGTVKNNLVNDLNVKPADKIKIVHNGIDLDKFSVAGKLPADLGHIRKPERYVIGFIGRMVYFKRPRLFVEVASELIEKDNRFFFVMVGDGPELEDCKKLIHQNGIENYFELLGFRRDIPDILGLFDAMLFTTSGEGFGIVIIEAMSMKIPVFAINDGAVPEIVIHRENGILLDSINPKVIAQQITETIEDKELIDKIKKQCVEDVHARFSIESCVNKIENVYKQVLNDARA